MKIAQRQIRILSLLFIFFYLIVLGVLLWSAVSSGYHFLFNPDEIFNANTVYLISKGFRPYVDFYTVYSPILHWFITPVFLLFGFTFKAISVSRIVMVGLFIIRLILLFLLVKRIFGQRVALIFVPLFLFDPFMVFAAMQIRPENLMMVFYILFLLVFSYAFESKSAVKFFLSGILLAFTFLINIKIIPSLLAFVLVFIYFALQKRMFSQLLMFVDGFCLTVMAFFLYFLIKGYLPEMFLHVFLDPVRLNGGIPNPTWLGYFYFSNPTIYGIEGRPINWMYAWALPVFAFAAGYKSLFYSFVGNGRDRSLPVMKIILFVSLVFQWLSMLFINSVFIQYYIPLNWLYAVFMAVFLHDLLFRINLAKLLRFGPFVLGLFLFVLLYQTSLTANFSRSKWRWDPYLDEFSKVWKMIPEDAPAFPNVVFRKPIYPILWGSTFAPYMRERYPPAYLAIEKYKLPILTFLNDEYFGFLDKATQDYIVKHYKRDQADSLIWHRVD